MSKQNKLAPADFIGKNGIYTIPDSECRIYVKIEEAVARFGRLDLKIVPEQGEGFAWVSHKAVEVEL